MAASFHTIPSKNPARHGGPLLLSFGPFSTTAINHICDSDDAILVNTQFPTFRNERSDCLRTGLLSILHYVDPECRMDMTALRQMICAGRNVETDIASAALFMAELGLGVKAFAGNFDRISEKPLNTALKYNLVEQRTLTWWLLQAISMSRLPITRMANPHSNGHKRHTGLYAAGSLKKQPCATNRQLL